ncbi:MAG: hypothetical protein ACFFCS_28595 [Candidatus Hodarchaeota archaeon]
MFGPEKGEKPAKLKKWQRVKLSIVEDIPDLEEEFPEFKGWEMIGFHRGLGQEFWQLIIEVFNMSLGLVIGTMLMPIMSPFPEIGGYQHVANSLFVLVYTVFDVGTNFGVGRFIAEYRVKDTKKMLEYISFFWWYQTWTGLIQVTILSWYTLNIITTSNLAYLTWIILLGMQKQYPGALGIFQHTLEGMQHLDKVEILKFFQNEIVQRIISIGLVIALRLYGEQNISYGILMMIVIGHILGYYIDDIIFSVVAVYFLKNILKKYFGLGLRDIFRVDYSRDVLRNVIFYGAQGSALPIVCAFVNLYRLLSYVNEINAYTTWTAIIGTGMGIAGQIGMFGSLSLTWAFAEAYPSGKKKLSEFYITYALRWRFFFMMMLSVIFVAIIPFYSYVIKILPGFTYYQGIEIFIIPGIIQRLTWVFVEIPDSAMIGARHITQHNIIRIIEEGWKVFFIWLFVHQWRIQETWGMFGLLYLIGFGDYVPIFIKTAVIWIYTQKKLVKIKINWIPTFVIPIIASLPLMGLSWLLYNTAFFPMLDAIGLYPTIIILILAFFIVIIYTYAPLSAMMGAFDDYQLHTLYKAVDLSGPSKPIFRGLAFLVAGSVKIARKLGTHGRFRIPYEEAHKEIRELMELKRADRKKNLEKIKGEK